MEKGVAIYLLAPTLVTTYDITLYDIPFEEQFRSIQGLSSCQNVYETWKSIADENLRLFSREYCISTASEELKEELTNKGIHVKRLVIRPPAGERKESIKPILDILAVCTRLTYIHWDRWHPFIRPPLSYLSQHRNLTRLEWYFAPDTATTDLFARMIECSPALKYITVMGHVEGHYTGSAFKRVIHVPASVTTLGICFGSFHIALWIKNCWVLEKPITLVAMVSGIAFKALAEEATTINLRSDLRITEAEPVQQDEFTFRSYLEEPARGTSRGTLAFSGIFFTPPSDAGPNQQLLRYEWVRVAVLKTLGRSCMTEEERWNALLPHLDFIDIPHHFPSLEEIYVYDDFHNWKERPELLAFEASVNGWQVRIGVCNMYRKDRYLLFVVILVVDVFGYSSGRVCACGLTKTTTLRNGSDSPVTRRRYFHLRGCDLSVTVM